MIVSYGRNTNKVEVIIFLYTVENECITNTSKVIDLLYYLPLSVHHAERGSGYTVTENKI